MKAGAAPAARGGAERSRRGRLLAASLLAIAAALVVWIRLLPLGLPAVPERATAIARGRVAERLAGIAPGPQNAQAIDAWIAAHPDEFAGEVDVARIELIAALQYDDAAGRAWPFLGDYDSYVWLRAARNYLRSGTVCDEWRGDECRDALALAPVGSAMRYGRSLHTAAIVGVHRLVTAIDPLYPLPASAYLVPVVVGALAVGPAFAIGRRLAGPFGGFAAAVVSALHPALLRRSIGSDNDIWNSALPLFMVWAIVAALQARRRAARIGCAALAGVVAGLHAATWRGWTFACAVTIAGLAAALAFEALRSLVRDRTWTPWRAETVRRIALVGIVYALATGACAYAAGAAWPEQLRIGTPGPEQLAEPPASLQWPSALAIVGELASPSLATIAALSYGYLAFYIGWLGMMLLLMPRRDWQPAHFAVLILATLLYRYLLTAGGVPLPVLTGLLLVPLAAALVVDLLSDGEAERDGGAGLLIVVWLLAALLMSYRASRFVLLLAAPLGIAVGVVAGRLEQWLAAAARARFGAGALATTVGAVAALLLTILPIRTAYAAAAAYLPMIDRAWADALEQVRRQTPSDAIVTTWWDYGHWVKYFAERQTSADGSTLLTHAPYWIARAELAPSEQEALGLLRMLNCGSDAEPYGEGSQGAYGRLMRAGLDGTAAYDAVLRLALLDRPSADAYLRDAGLDDAARSAVLSATHCAPPASYLLMSSEQAAQPGYWQLGTWDPRRSGRAADPQRANMGQRGFTTVAWARCAAHGSAWRCPIGYADARGRRIDAVTYADDDLAAARLETTAAGERRSAAPDLVLVVDGAGVTPLRSTDVADDATAVLLDPRRHRVLVGTPSALRSLYTRLVFLDGLGVTRLHRIDARTGIRGAHISTWRVDW